MFRALEILRKANSAVGDEEKKLEDFFGKGSLKAVGEALLRMEKQAVWLSERPVEVDNLLPVKTKRNLVGYRETEADGSGVAYTLGVGTDALVTFFPAALGYDGLNLELAILHEIAHATEGVAAEDLAYLNERYFSFLSDTAGLHLRNADSLAFAVATLAGIDFSAERGKENLTRPQEMLGGFDDEEGMYLFRSLAYADRFIKQSLLAVFHAIAEVDFLLANPKDLKNQKIQEGVYLAVAQLVPDKLYSLTGGFSKTKLTQALERLRRLAGIGERAQPKLHQPSFFQNVDDDTFISWTGGPTHLSFGLEQVNVGKLFFSNVQPLATLFAFAATDLETYLDDWDVLDKFGEMQAVGDLQLAPLRS